ncbi:MAG: NYN domain-containing protein [Rikenellaceae bacterium]|nr:NYN domain-containing protein [Rikenellaceae bacterium]MCL2691888.1 NYN domain-containing protein [Rikenellaceae bacterium]
MNNYSPLRVGVFYDGNFLLHASNYYNYIHPQKSRLSISGLHSFISKRVAKEEGIEAKWSHIVEAHYFRGRISAAEASQRGNQLYNDRVFEDILMTEGIKTHYLPLRNFGGRKEERGIDVWLSLEVYEYALRERIDVAVLIISDTDYVPLLRKLNSLGIRVMLLAWEFDYINNDGVKVVTKTSHELLQLATYPIPMHEEIDHGIKKKNSDIISLFVDSGGGGNAVNEYVRPQQEPMPEVAEGEIQVSQILSIKNGFGFVRYPNNNLFFHQLDVVGDFFELAPGDTVEFTIDKNQMKQDVAKNVRKIAPQPPAEIVAEEDDADADVDEFDEDYDK